MADSNGKWDDPEDIIHGVTESRGEVSVKFTRDEEQVLIARGHLKDVQPDTDHFHGWNQKTGVPDHHDKRTGH